MKRKPSPYALPIEPRKRLSKKRRAQLFLERGGRCHMCKRKIEAGERWVAEHYVALENQGTNEWKNWDVTCYRGCFTRKNRTDRKIASKGRRLRKGEAEHKERLIRVDVRGEKGGKSRHRPIPGSKASGWKKRMDGTWIRR